MGLKRFLRSFLGFRENKVRPISSIQVELTNHCNCTCRICPQSQWRLPEFSKVPYDRSKGFMEFDLFRTIIDEANEISHEINISFFGEHMMHPEFLKFMDYLEHRSRKLRLVMNTNLSYATRSILRKLIAIKMTDLRLSIDAATAETYDIVRPGKHYVNLDGKAESGNRFETICQKAEYWFSLSDHRPTRHVFTVNSKNVEELGAFVKRWLPLLGEEDVILSKSVLTYGGKIWDEMIESHPCNVWDMNMLTVDWTGRVSPCNLDTNMDLTIGSIPQNSLLELNKGEKYREIEHLSKARLIVPCKTCVDGNNWSRNIVFRKGQEWKDEYYWKYRIEQFRE